MKKTRLAVASAAAVVSASVLALSAGAYNAYIGLQTQTYSFRNAWTEASYGKATPYFNGWIVWGDGDNPEETFPDYEDNFDYDINGYVLPASYTDASFDADGTYTVKAEGIDWALKGETDFNLVFVSTDLPANAGLTISDVAVAVDGTVVKTVDSYTYDETAEYIEIDLANIWNPDIGAWGLAFPTSDVSIQFTVAGLSAVADTAADTAAAPAAGDVDAATDSSKGSPDTGIADVAAIAGLGLVAVGAIVVTRKRK